MSEVTRILSQIEHGDSAAAEQLLPLVYDELRKLAAAKLEQEKPGQTLQPTALVHEAYLRLVRPGAKSQESGAREAASGDEKLVPGPRPLAAASFDSRGHFFAAAVEAMRRILVESARRKRRLRHGGGQQRVELSNELPDVETRPDEILAVHEALEKLAAVDSQAAELVKLHYFGGLSVEEAAPLLGISARAAYRNWSFARAWLFRHLQPEKNA